MPSRRRPPRACSGPAPPKAMSAKLARVEPAVDRDQPDRVGHVLVGDVARPRARLLGASSPRRVAERRRARARAASRSSAIAPAEEVRRVEPAEHEVGVGHGRLGRRRGRRRRARGRRPALRGPTCSRPPRVDPGDRAAAGADRRDRDARDGDREAEGELELVGVLLGLAVDGSRPMSQLVPPMSSVKSVAHARSLGVAARRRSTPPARPESSELRRALARLVARQIAAVGGQQLPLRGRPAPLAELVVHARRRSRSIDRLHEGVGDGRQARSYSRQTGDDLVREREPARREHVAHALAATRSSCCRVDVGEQQADGDRGVARRRSARSSAVSAASRATSSGCELACRRARPARHAEAVAPPHERLRACSSAGRRGCALSIRPMNGTSLEARRWSTRPPAGRGARAPRSSRPSSRRRSGRRGPAPDAERRETGADGARRVVRAWTAPSPSAPSPSPSSKSDEVA